MFEAAALADDLDDVHPLRRKTRWRLAKAHHDADDAASALEAVRPLLEQDEPFLGYPQGLEGVGALAVHAWHRLGYGEPGVERLFVAAEAALTDDPVRATQARLQRLWGRACRGDLDQVAEELSAFATLAPGAFETGPSRHPRAPDAGGSVAWLQLDAARTGLRAATWARHSDLADAAEDLFEDAATDADLDRNEEIWFLEPIALCRRRLDRPDPDDYAAAWFSLAGRVDYPRRAYHHRLALAEQARSENPERTAQRYAEAASAAQDGDYGPEWVVDALLQAGDVPGASALVDRYGVGVFAGTLSDTSAT